jgi:hypothetical protein
MVFLHFLVIYIVVLIGYATPPIGNRIIPCGIYMIILSINAHHVPGMSSSGSRTIYDITIDIRIETQCTEQLRISLAYTRSVV